ncbi:MAG: DUF4959 domain-containing protein [Bacteroidales bacterium]|jgi:hypothetical protein|nr:DUF4959 domain-containing protein [Bacteroidales bacterium]
MKIFKNLLIVVFVTAIFFACSEEDRFGISSDDDTVPGVPTDVRVVPLDGGARIFYKLPSDEQLLQVVAEVIEPTTGKSFKFSASYYRDSLDVWALGEQREYTFNIWAETRAGKKSAMVPVTVTPKKSGIWHVKESLSLAPGFGALLIDWLNKLEQTIHLHVELDFLLNGEPRNVKAVYSSNLDSTRYIFGDLPHGGTVSAKIHVEDIYGNSTDQLEVSNIDLLKDMKIPKREPNETPIWVLPKANDSIDWVPMCFGDGADGRINRVIDDVLDLLNGSCNYLNTNNRGRTGIEADGNARWSLIIDLGGYWHVSRIITNQRWDYTAANPKNRLYGSENVGHFAIWVLDEDQEGTVNPKYNDVLPPNRRNHGEDGWNIYGEMVKGTWVKLSEHYIPTPVGLAAMEYYPLGLKGDESYVFPQTPGYSKPIRWFRYEAIGAFEAEGGIPYTKQNHNCLSEITLFGMPAGEVDEENVYHPIAP